MVVSVLWAVLGAAFGALGVWLLHKLLLPALRGEGSVGAIAVGIAPMMHFVLLLIAAQFGKDALLSAGIADAASTLACGICLFIRGRKKK